MIRYKFKSHGNWETQECWESINKIVNSLHKQDIYISVVCFKNGFANYIELIAGEREDVNQYKQNDFRGFHQ